MTPPASAATHRTTGLGPTLASQDAGTHSGPNAPDRVNTGTSHFVDAVTFLRNGEHKLIYDRKGSRPAEVYRSSDHDEKINLAGDAELVSRLKQQRKELLVETRIDIGQIGTSDMSREEIQQLCSFGYLSDAECELTCPRLSYQFPS